MSCTRVNSNCYMYSHSHLLYLLVRSTLKRLLSGRLRYGHVSLPGTFSLSSYSTNASNLVSFTFSLYVEVLIFHCKPM